MNLLLLFINLNVSESEDAHNSWLHCFTDPLEIGTRVSLSYRQRNTCPKFKMMSETIQTRVVYVFNYELFHREASAETIKLVSESFRIFNKTNS